MSAAEIRKKLHKYIDKIDEHFLKAVYALIEEYAKEDIVGYKPGGKPITKSDLTKRAQQSEEDIKAGRVYSQEDVEAHFKGKAANG